MSGSLSKGCASKLNYNTSPNKQKETRVKEIVKLVQKVYSKFEKGEIDHKGFTKTICGNLNVNSPKLDEIMKSAKEDKKDFKNIIKNLGIFNRPTYHPEFTTDDIKNSTAKKYPRFIKQKAANEIKTPMHTERNFFGDFESKSDPKKEVLKEYVNQFTKGFIDSKTFENALKSKNINPEIEEIKKHIRTASTGMSHKGLMCSVMKYNDCKYSNDPNKIKPNFRELNNYDHGKFEDDSHGIVELRGKEIVLIKRRKKKENDPNLVSQKDVFEWETNADGDEDYLRVAMERKANYSESPTKHPVKKRDPNLRQNPADNVESGRTSLRRFNRSLIESSDSPLKIKNKN